MASKKIVLVVDDEKNIRRLLSVVIERANLCAVECSDASSGKTTFRDNVGNIVAVFVDYMMPGETGVHLVEYIRKLDSGVPIIAVTARDDSHKAFLAAGVDAILAKPFCVRTITQMVNQYACRGASSGRLPAIGGQDST